MATVNVAVVLVVASCAVILCAVSALPYKEGISSELYNELRELAALSSELNKKNDKTKSTNNYEETQAVKREIPQAVKNWPEIDLNLGQVSGVSVNSKFQPVVFHRGDRVWDENTFNDSDHYQQIKLGPIRAHTVLTLDPKSGHILSRWGDNMFYMPHGLTIDKHDNFWVTDVALHQAFKFRSGKDEPDLIFGEPFEPGTGLHHLCKPTHIAVASTGEIFIADGYCNSRILKFNAAGGLLRVIPNPPEFLPLLVPHALALIEPLDRICIADRENMRVTCPGAGLFSDKVNNQALTIQRPDMGRVFGVAAIGTTLYAVNGPTPPLQVRGLIIDPKSEAIIDDWAPNEGFGNPHAIAACPNGSALYVVEIGPNRVWKFELNPSKHQGE